MLRMLCGAKPSMIKAVLNGASPDLIHSLSECSLNILKGRVKLTPAQKKQLSRYKYNLRALADKRTTVKKRKQILQRGGFIGALLKPVLSVLGGLFNL